MSKKSLAIVIIVVCAVALSSYAAMAYSDSAAAKPGKILRGQQFSASDDTVAIKGNNITVTQKEINDVAEVYKQSGDTSPVDSAVRFLLETKVLYNKAVSEGYFISDDEYDADVKKLKESIKTAENYTMYEDLVNGYGGEEAYYSDLKEKYKISMAINKYLNAERNQYFSSGDALQNVPEEGTTDLLTGWNDVKDNLVTGLIKDEDITIESNELKDLPYLKLFAD